VPSPHLNDLIAARLSRRQALRLGAAAALTPLLPAWAREARGAPLVARAAAAPPDAPDAHLWLKEGYVATRLISWGDRLRDGAAPPMPLESAEAQLGAFGYNNDFIAYHPLPAPPGERRGLLSVNHEYTCPRLMFPGLPAPAAEDPDAPPPLSPERLRVEMAAVGHSVLEVRRDARGWGVAWGSPYARRLSALGPLMPLRGPVAGHPRVRTAADPEGRAAVGTLANCAGGVTPWGTTLIAEENFNQHFVGDPEALRAGPPEARREVNNLLRSDIAAGAHGADWHLVDPRFSIAREPRESNRYGWIVELDPRDPARPPVKRTALGRFKHECATCALTADGRVAVYSGDDQQGEHVYRFVSRRPYDPADPASGWGLLDDGALQAARFEEGGRVVWLDLTWGEGPLTPANGFDDQGDVLIEARRAATLLGATPLDRPEDVEVSPLTGRVYVMLTQHKARKAPAPASPRAPNPLGHIVELTPAGGDHGAREGRWEVLLLGGSPEAGGLRNPDNASFDPQGRLWVTADAHSSARPPFANGLWRCEVDGAARGSAERFCAVPAGAEPCGPCFTPEGDALFLSVQHPGEGSTWEDPATRWPEHRSDRPPRPSLIVVERAGGGAL